MRKVILEEVRSRCPRTIGEMATQAKRYVLVEDDTTPVDYAKEMRCVPLSGDGVSHIRCAAGYDGEIEFSIFLVHDDYATVTFSISLTGEKDDVLDGRKNFPMEDGRFFANHYIEVVAKYLFDLRQRLNMCPVPAFVKGN